jgi:hypothetical protein
LISLALLSVASTLATASPPGPPVQQCFGDTTPALEACLGRKLAAAKALESRYRIAAVTRVGVRQFGPGGGSRTVRPLQERLLGGEKAFEIYRAAQCEAVYDFWADGTIWGSKELDCEIRLTQLRTHEIWTEWLTFIGELSG